MAFFKKDTTETSETAATPAAATGSRAALKSTAALRSILIQPRISEKAGKMAESGKYIFKVATTSNKIEVKKAVEAIYRVRVTQVNIINVKGKNRSFGKTKGATSHFKKAVVTLRKGDVIETETVA